MYYVSSLYGGAASDKFIVHDSGVLTRRIAKVRIHVERVIQRIKTFHILDKTMSLSFHIVADDIFKTCALLTNFQSPIIK